MPLLSVQVVVFVVYLKSLCQCLKASTTTNCSLPCVVSLRGVQFLAPIAQQHLFLLTIWLYLPFVKNGSYVSQTRIRLELKLAIATGKMPHRRFQPLLLPHLSPLRPSRSSRTTAFINPVKVNSDPPYPWPIILEHKFPRGVEMRLRKGPNGPERISHILLGVQRSLRLVSTASRRTGISTGPGMVRELTFRQSATIL